MVNMLEVMTGLDLGLNKLGFKTKVIADKGLTAQDSTLYIYVTNYDNILRVELDEVAKGQNMVFKYDLDTVTDSSQLINTAISNIKVFLPDLKRVL